MNYYSKFNTVKVLISLIIIHLIHYKGACFFLNFMDFKSINHSLRKKYWENCIYRRHSFLWSFLSSNNRLKNSPHTGWNSNNHSECFWLS